jgi:membrane-associated phospholipid phosphatase
MPVDPSSAPPRDPGARATLRLLLRGGPVGRGIARADLAAYRAIRRTATPPEVVAVVSRFSSLGEHAGLWLAVGAIGTVVDVPRRERWRKAVTGVALAYLANFGLKNVFRRKRPLLEDLPQLIKTPTALSFPSAHATSSFAAARAYAPLLPTGPLYAVAGTMALSRVYLGVHYPTDIVAGATFGTIMGSLAR